MDQDDRRTMTERAVIGDGRGTESARDGHHRGDERNGEAEQQQAVRTEHDGGSRGRVGGPLQRYRHGGRLLLRPFVSPQPVGPRRHFRRGDAVPRGRLAAPSRPAVPQRSLRTGTAPAAPAPPADRHVRVLRLRRGSPAPPQPPGDHAARAARSAPVGVEHRVATRVDDHGREQHRLALARAPRAATPK